MSVLRKSALSILGVGLGLCATELVMQGFAYARWSRQAQAATREGGCDVLCVGDSYTFGAGASGPERAYPLRLQEHLATALERPSAVVNGGWPGQTSRQVLLRLPGQLDQYRPRVVCILVGINDLGYAVERVSPDEEGEAMLAQSFPWKFRLGLLAHHAVEWMRGGSAFSKQRREQQPFLGSWHGDGREMTFRPDGVVETSDGPMQWSAEGDQLVLDAAMGRARIACTWRIEEDVLHLELPTGAVISLQSGRLPEPPILERAHSAWRDGDVAAAHEAYEAAYDQPRHRDEARLGLVRVLRHHGDTAAADAHVDALEAGWREGRMSAARPVLVAHMEAGRYQTLFDLVLEMEKAGAPFPISSLFDTMTADASGHDRMQVAIEKVLQREGLQPMFRAQLLRARYLVDLPSDRDAALRTLVQAELVHPQVPYTFHALRNNEVTEDEVARQLDALSAEPAQREYIGKLYRGELPELAGTGATLGYHLRRIIARCREVGAQPVLLIYPFPMRQQAQTVREVEREAEVPVLSLVEPFEAELRTRALGGPVRGVGPLRRRRLRPRRPSGGGAHRAAAALTPTWSRCREACR